MKRIVLPLLLFAALIWLVPLAGFLLGGRLCAGQRPKRHAGLARAAGHRTARQRRPGPVRGPAAAEQHRGRAAFDL